MTKYDMRIIGMSQWHYEEKLIRRQRLTRWACVGLVAFMAIWLLWEVVKLLILVNSR